MTTVLSFRTRLSEAIRALFDLVPTCSLLEGALPSKAIAQRNAVGDSDYNKCSNDYKNYNSDYKHDWVFNDWFFHAFTPFIPLQGLQGKMQALHCKPCIFQATCAPDCAAYSCALQSAFHCFQVLQVLSPGRFAP